jgi:hypothetical protein
MVTMTAFTFAETWMPKQITPVSTSTISAATRLCPSL